MLCRAASLWPRATTGEGEYRLAVRIYTLAKELNLDSKLLVDLCTKAGVTGKGSALASLADDEVVKVKAFIAGGGRAVATAPAPPKPAAVIAPPPAAPTTAKPPVSTAATTFARPEYIAPTGVPARPPVLTSSRSNEGRRSNEGGKPPVRVAPSIRLAKMPDVEQPAPPPPPVEQETLKPDIRLPADVLRASKAGQKPLQAHLDKAEAKRNAEQEAAKKKPLSRAPAAPATDGDAARRDRGRGKKPDAPVGDVARKAFSGALGGREHRQLSRRRVPDGSGREDDRPRRSSRLRMRRTGTNTAAPRKGKVAVEIPCTVRSFSEAIGIRASQVQAKLLGMGTMATINSELDSEKIELLAIEFGVEIELKQPVDLADELLGSIRDAEDSAEQLEPRPPIVTFLGHVDHGKTSLLDRIIGINVVAGESGGITQHIRAYRVERDGRAIAFVDTPGHEAFTQMRARGANVTDIAVLVVAADDGVMPQTEEAISHARAAEVPIVVALNKVDLPGVNYDRIFTQLSSAGLQPSEWGGDTEVVRTSAHNGQGIDELLDTLLTIADLHGWQANPARAAFGTCLESEQTEGRGVMAKFIVQNGSLKVGDVVVCGSTSGRVKAMYDTLDPRKSYEVAPPSTPVNITGLDEAPAAGEHFYVIDDITKAREIAETRKNTARRSTLGSGGPVHVSLENLFDRLRSDEVQTLNLILRADTRGSIEAILKELQKLDHPEVQIKILQATVGGVTEADVHLADASDAIIIGFNVVPDEGARTLADSRGVQVRRYDIIYQVTQDLKAALEGMLKPEERSVDLGRALVQKVFAISRVGAIAGCRVLSGTIERNCRVRVIRDSRVIGDYGLDSLKREKDDAREVREGYECGMKLAGFNDVKEGDILEAYKVEEVARTL